MVMTRARFQTKVVEVNPLQCTCHAKCSGLRNPALPEFEQKFYETYVFARASTRITPISRVSMTVKNNTVHAPVRCISSAAPSMSSCTVDGSTQLKHLPLYTLEIVPSAGNLIYYAHRFYISNSNPITDQLYRGGCNSSATGQYCGLCYGGSRRCWKPLVGIIKSIKQHGLPAPFTNAKTWWQCVICQSRYPEFYPGYHNLFVSLLHENTCLSEVYALAKKWRSPERAVEQLGDQICRGCRASIICRHTLTGYLNYMRKNSITKTFSLDLLLLLLAKFA